MIDLRSDTVTKPTQAMRQAMATAEVGDDVYREDPTVNALEQRAAEITGKEAAIFLPTGTMGNTIAIKLHTQHGQEVICDSRAHLLDWELSMLAWFSGCLIRAVPTEQGILNWPDIRKVAKPVGPHWAPTGCIEIENTHNMAGGRVYPLGTIQEICHEAHAMGIKVHMDGARVFNAAEAAGVFVADVVRHVDTVTFCLSKALGAPVGSMLCGPHKEMEEARLLRKRLGGGMRQAGILAAAGLIAMNDSPQGLAQDHKNAQYLAREICKMPGVDLDPTSVETNIVIFDITATKRTAQELSAELKKRGVLMNGISPTHLRAVTHYGVCLGDCETATYQLCQVLQEHAT